MPVKNAPTTTWYKPTPIHPTSGHPRHGPQQAAHAPSKSGGQVTGHSSHHTHHPVTTGSPKHMPSIPSTGLPYPSQPLRHTTHVHSSQVLPSSSRGPGGHSSQVPPLLPSKLPTSTSSSSSASSSPKRSLSPSKIASPTRVKNTDRLPPISKGPASLVGVEQVDVTGSKPAVTSGQKAKGKDGKEVKEKLNENRLRRSSSERFSSPSASTKIKTNRESLRKEKGENEGGTMTTTVKKKKNIENKMETKTNVTLPKRKKSERSNSDNEIKPKKIDMKDLPVISVKLEEMKEKNSTTSTTTTTTTTATATTSTTTTAAAVTPTAPATAARSLSRDRSSSGKIQDKSTSRISKQPRKQSSASGSSPSSPSSGSSTLKFRPTARQSQKDQALRNVEKMLKEMAVGKEAETDVDEALLGRSIERSLEGVLSAQVKEESEVKEMSEMECTHDKTGEEEPKDNLMICDDEDDNKDVCMEDESVEGEYNIEDEERFGDHEKRGTEHAGESVMVKENEQSEDSQMMSLGENVIFSSESHHPECVVGTPGQAMDSTLPAVSIINDDAEDADHSMRDEDSMRDDRSMVDVVEISEHMLGEEEIARNNDDFDQSMEDATLIVELADDGTVESVILMDDDTPSIKEEIPSVSAPERALETLEREVKRAEKKEEKEKQGDKVQARESKVKIGNSKPSPKISLVKKVPEKTPKRDLSVKRETKTCDDAKNKKKEEDETTKVRSKRKMDAEKTRGGTKKPAILFVDKGSTVSGDGGDSRGSRDSRILTSTRVNISNAEKKRSDASAPPRRPRLDNIKSTIPKPGRLPPRKLTDPVKAARPGGPTSGPRGPHHVGHGGIGGPGPHERQHVVPHAEQLRRLEAELTARATELKAARAEREHAERGVEALTVLIHHLTSNYEPFSCPRLKAEVVRLNQQLTDTRLSLDESTAAVRRLQEEAAQSLEQHGQKVQELEQRHRQALEKLTKQHQHDLDKAIEKHRKEMSKFAEEQQGQREDVSRAHAAELERLEGEWRNKLDLQHEKHLCAVQELNTNHTHKLRELETSRQAREFELEESNHRLKGEQEALKAQSRKLEESLLNDTDHRLQAVRNMCSSLKSEVDSLKTVVEMKNSEIHTLRAQVVEMGRLSKDLEVARDRAKSLQAKTEDLQAQMEKRSLSERHLVNEHRLLVETCQREANINKRLSLENEELAWKLRQREEMYTSLPSSTLDLVSRSPGTLRRQEGAPSPQAAPHSPRVAVRSSSGKISPSKCEVSKRRSRWGLSPEDGVNGDDRIHDVSIDSPPPSPCVKAVVEKSNSVSFILDLNDSQSDDSFLDLPPSPRPRPQRTASLSAADRPRTPIHTRRVLHNNRANSLNRNGKSDFNGKKKEVNGKSHDTNGHGSQPSSGRSASESSEGGEMERVSPTGLAWTVPVHSPKSPVKTNPTRQNGSPVRGRLEHHLLEDPDEDEYEETPEGTHQFIEVVELSRVGLSSSEAASDSELSQCDLIKGESSTESDSEESTDGDSHTQNSSHHEPLGRKNGPWCPKDGAGEAMITDEILKQYPGDPLPTRGKRPPRRCFPSAPSSDSDDNMNAHHEGTAVDVSWSEDITSSSEMHEL